MPYLIGLGMDVPLDLHREYASIMKLYQEQQAPVPIRAFSEIFWSGREGEGLTLLP